MYIVALADFALGMVSTYLKVCYNSRECSSKSYIKQDLGYECSKPQESQSFYNDLRLQVRGYHRYCVGNMRKKNLHEHDNITPQSSHNLLILTHNYTLNS